MKTAALALAATLALSTTAMAQGTPPANSVQPHTGTMTTAKPDGTTSGPTNQPGSANHSSSPDSMGHSSTGAKGAGSASTPGAGGTSGSGR